MLAYAYAGCQHLLLRYNVPSPNGGIIELVFEIMRYPQFSHTCWYDFVVATCTCLLRNEIIYEASMPLRRIPFLVCKLQATCLFVCSPMR